MAARSLRAAQLLLLSLLCVVLVGLSAAKHLGDGPASAHHHQHQHSATTHHRRRLQRDSRAKDPAGGAPLECEPVKSYFDSIDIKSSGSSNEKGAICGGSCCNNATELELREKAAGMFEQLLHHHTSSLRGILETNAKQFQSHVLELATTSENKTLIVFSKVYTRMVPLSRMMIKELYSQIMNHLVYTSNYTNGQHSSRAGFGSIQNSLEEAVHAFFEQLFPVAYHQAVHLSGNSYDELHKDYVSCLKHNFNDMRPFGDIPRELQASLVQSVHISNVFMKALLEGAEVLSEADALYGEQLSDTCKQHLLKMHYCPNCNGHQSPRHETKVCYGYCINVLRGCSAKFAGLLDNPWLSVVEGLSNLVTTHILSDSGIISTIKTLDQKLSEAIMHAMKNGPELEQKVKKTCGTPSFAASLPSEPETRPAQHKGSNKWATPPDPGMVRFLSTIDKTKEFYTNIVDNFCEEEYSRVDHSCWTGDRFGEYSQLQILSGMDNQRYNPEVPFTADTKASKLNELVDKLIKIRKNIGAAAPSNSIQTHDIQSDMGHEGSGGGEGRIGDDEEDYGGANGSGDGSGDGGPPIDETVPSPKNDDESSTSPGSGSDSLGPLGSATSLLLTLVTILLCRSS